MQTVFSSEATAALNDRLSHLLLDGVSATQVARIVLDVLLQEISFRTESVSASLDHQEQQQSDNETTELEDDQTEETDLVDVALVQAFPFADSSAMWPPFDTTRADKSRKELVEIMNPTMARNTLLQVTTGYKHRTSDNQTPPAQTNHQGCWLAQGAVNASGHVSVRPLVPASGTRVVNGTARTPRRSAQYVHRLAVKAWFGEADIRRLHTGGQQHEVSHLCGSGRCYRPDHLTVESHSLNERRKHCQGSCHCRPRCIR